MLLKSLGKFVAAAGREEFDLLGEQRVEARYVD